MKPLEPPASHYLRAAQGWFELGIHREAEKELDELTPPQRTHPDVLDLRWHIYAQTKQWDACVDVASTILKLEPSRSDAWIHRSFALHELKRTQEAFDNLVAAAEKFPKLWMIPYNLACYCAQLGRLGECERWFEKAMAIDQHTVQRAAADDPDLKPVWASLSGTFRKRSE